MTNVQEIRRRQILKAATACFVRRGFHQTTMQEICREANLSPGSIYRYYPSKEEIIAVLVEESCLDFLSLIDSIRDRTDFVTAFDDLAEAVLEKIRDPELCILHVEANAEGLRNPRMAEIVERLDTAKLTALSERIRNAQANGVIDPKIDPDMSAQILMALMKGLAMRKSLNPELDTIAHAPIIKTLISRFFQTGHS